MSSARGEAKVRILVSRASAAARRGEHEDAVQARMRSGIARIERRDGEVKDTEVRQAIAGAMDAEWQAAYGHPFDEWLGMTPGPIVVSLPFQPE